MLYDTLLLIWLLITILDLVFFIYLIIYAYNYCKENNIKMSQAPEPCKTASRVISVIKLIMVSVIPLLNVVIFFYFLFSDSEGIMIKYFEKNKIE